MGGPPSLSLPLRNGKDKFSLPKGVILGRFGELGSAAAKSEDDRLYGIAHAEVGEVVAGELMSIASSLELACRAEDIGGRGFCLPYPGVAKDETCLLPVGTTSHTSMR